MGLSRRNSLVTLILECLDPAEPVFGLETAYDYIARKKKISRRQFRDSVRGLKTRGIIEVTQKNNEKFYKLTKKGALETLLIKAKYPFADNNWDGKWRLLIFDIPEAFHLDRDRFRLLLKQNGFIKLQGSVFISPHTLAREGVDYLKTAGLYDFVRIMKIEEMDNDLDLRKKFGFKVKTPR